LVQVVLSRAGFDEKANLIVIRMERTYRSSRTLQATFLERYLENGREVQSDAGVAYFGRPGRMRWEYQFPERNLYLIDGKWSWFYVPADHTVTRVRARESSDWRTPLALLAGEMKVSRICAEVSTDSGLQPSIASNVMFRCELRGSKGAPLSNGRTPLSVEANDKVLFEVNATNGELARILILDPGGVEVEFRFANWRFDPPLDPKIFRFEPPKGVAIVDGDPAMQTPTSRAGRVGSPLNVP